jgi:hypothetical protein
MQDDATKQPSQCKLLAEDYIECLHHHKQVIFVSPMSISFDFKIHQPTQILKLKRIAIETEKFKEAVIALAQQLRVRAPRTSHLFAEWGPATVSVSNSDFFDLAFGCEIWM